MRQCWVPLEGDHPRIRGEHPVTARARDANGGSSPHTRGAPHERRPLALDHGIIPAYAGSTAIFSLSIVEERDHPRIRGEHRLTVHREVPGAGSSPHTRGARHASQGSFYAAGIIPAYAGSTCLSVPRHGRLRDHPRIRGEHVSGRSDPHKKRGSSPHTRGALVVFSLDPHFRRIIPAYAGST